MVDNAFLEEIEEQAALYALDALPAIEARSFQERLATGCALCQSLLKECSQAIAMLPFELPETPAPAGLRERLLERIGVAPADAKMPMAAATVVRAGDTEWEQSGLPGVDIRKLLGKRTMLVRMAPGTVYPRHEHTADEQCLVLEGSINSDDLTVHAGDFTYFPAGSTHGRLYTETGCLLLIAYT